MFFSKVEPIVAVLMSKIIKTTVDYRIAKRNEMKLKMNATTSKRRVSYQNTQSWNIAGITMQYPIDYIRRRYGHVPHRCDAAKSTYYHSKLDNGTFHHHIFNRQHCTDNRSSSNNLYDIESCTPPCTPPDTSDNDSDADEGTVLRCGCTWVCQSADRTGMVPHIQHSPYLRHLCFNEEISKLTIMPPTFRSNMTMQMSHRTWMVTPQNTFKLRRCCNVISTKLQSRIAITNESRCTQLESNPERCATGVSFTECALPDSDPKSISPGTCCVATETCCAEPEKQTQSSAHGFNKVTVETLNDRVGSGNIRMVTKEQIDIIATGTNRAVSEERFDSIPKTDKITRVVTEEQNSRLYDVLETIHTVCYTRTIHTTNYVSTLERYVTPKVQRQQPLQKEIHLILKHIMKHDCYSQTDRFEYFINRPIIPAEELLIQRRRPRTVIRMFARLLVAMIALRFLAYLVFQDEWCCYIPVSRSRGETYAHVF